VREVQEALGAPLATYINSMVIQAAEPVIVDTGSRRNRDRWREDVYSLVDPNDVRWVFVSHEDPDHIGNLGEVLDDCPHARLVCSWAIVERLSNAFDFPLERCRWVNDGESFEVGDRTLRAVRPPVYDLPTTRGLLDTSTGVYWAADSFATPVPRDGDRIATHVDQLDPALWWEGMVMFGLNALSPWLSIVDGQEWSRSLKRIRDLAPETILSGHSPIIAGADVTRAIDLVGALAGTAPPPCPDQAVLDLLLTAMGDVAQTS
jgi:flavorubredoxin